MSINNPILNTNLHEFHINEISFNNTQLESIINIIIEDFHKPHTFQSKHCNNGKWAKRIPTIPKLKHTQEIILPPKTHS